MIGWFLRTTVGRWLSGALGAIVAFLVWRAHERRDAAEEARRRALEDDYENARDIRNRVERNLADRLRQHDDAGWRDR